MYHASTEGQMLEPQGQHVTSIQHVLSSLQMYDQYLHSQTVEGWRNVVPIPRQILFTPVATFLNIYVQQQVKKSNTMIAFSVCTTASVSRYSPPQKAPRTQKLKFGGSNPCSDIFES